MGELARYEGRNVTPAALTPELNALMGAARSLPPELVRQVTDFAEFLGKKHAAPPAVDESDDWSKEDLREFALAAMRRFEAEHPDDDWGTDYNAPGGR